MSGMAFRGPDLSCAFDIRESPPSTKELSSMRSASVACLSLDRWYGQARPAGAEPTEWKQTRRITWNGVTEPQSEPSRRDSWR